MPTKPRLKLVEPDARIAELKKVEKQRELAVEQAQAGVTASADRIEQIATSEDEPDRQSVLAARDDSLFTKVCLDRAQRRLNETRRQIESLVGGMS